MTIGGSSSAAQGVVIGTAITVGGNINLAGRSTNAGNNALDINAALTSTGGDITLSADTMKIDAAVKAGNTGANTVTVKTVTTDNKIDIGSGTGTSGVDAVGTLGLSQAELNRIMAGNLVIGNTASSGNITVSGAATTAASTGDITLKTGGSIAVNAALNLDDPTGTKNLTLDAGGAITNGASGKLTAKDLTLKAGSTIGANGAAIKTNAATANLTSAGNQFLVEDNNVSVTAKTTGNGNINITTTNGTMKVEPVNGFSGIDAGTGNVNLKATSGSDHGIVMRSDVKGKDITVDATANNGTGLGFYGAGGSFNASGSLNLTGTATGTGNGLYTFVGEFKAGTGINITGTSANGQGVGFDANAKLINTSGDIVIKGTANGANTQGIGIRGVSIINGENNVGGSIKLEAAKGDIFVSEVKPTVSPWNLVAPLTNTIIQNGTGDVKLTTVSNGNITVPLIVNNGAGNVIVAAGIRGLGL